MTHEDNLILKVRWFGCNNWMMEGSLHFEVLSLEGIN